MKDEDKEGNKGTNLLLGGVSLLGRVRLLGWCAHECLFLLCHVQVQMLLVLLFRRIKCGLIPFYSSLDKETNQSEEVSSLLVSLGSSNGNGK
jgi:hypothetical protein